MKSKLDTARDALTQLRALPCSEFSQIKECLTSSHRCEDLEVSDDEGSVYRCGYFGDSLGPLARRCPDCRAEFGSGPK